MGKTFRKVKDLCKKYIFKNKIVSIIIGVCIIAILLFVILNRPNVDSIRKVKKILSNNYYKVECMSDSCDYVIAYSGDKLGKTKILIYNAYGKKIASYTEQFNSKDKTVRNISSVTKNYIIFKNDELVSGNTKNYLLSTTKGKTKYNSENVLYGLNDNLVSEKTDDGYSIIDKNGKTLYTNVSDIDTLAEGKYLSVKIKNEDVILDENGKPILNGYKIAKQVKGEDNKAIYFVLQDSNKNAYYYYNIKTNKIEGDSFNGYVEGSEIGELIITKKENNDSVKYILKGNGTLEKINKVSMDDLKVIDASKYEVVSDSYIVVNQTSVLVQDTTNNSFGSYNLKNNKYTKLFSFKDDNKKVGISKLLSTEKDLYLQISYTNADNKDNVLIVYDMVNDKKLYSVKTNDYEIQYYTNYGDYNVIKYSNNSSEEYRGKFAVYDKNNKELVRSDNEIIIIDKKLVFGKEPSSYSLLLFSAKKNKVINDSESLANKSVIGKSYIYKYNTTDKTYIYNSKGVKLKEINSSKASLIYSSDTIIYVENNKVFIINPTANKTSTYKLRTNERINSYDGESIPPYRNTLFINNTVNNNIRIVNVNGRVIKNIKNSIIESVDYNKDSKNVVIVTRQVKNNNNYYGLYIGK